MARRPLRFVGTKRPIVLGFLLLGAGLIGITAAPGLSACIALAAAFADPAMDASEAIDKVPDHMKIY